MLSQIEKKLHKHHKLLIDEMIPKQEALEASITRPKPDYLELDPAKAEGKILAAPQADHLPLPVNLQAIVEFYSQKL